MAEVCCVGDSKAAPAASSQPSARSSRRRRLELLPFEVAAEVVIPPPLRENRKRRKVKVHPRECKNAVLSTSSNQQKRTEGIEEPKAEQLQCLERKSVEKEEGYTNYGMTSVCGRRRDMEDAVSIRTSFCNQNPGLHFYGVFDGHGCSHVATSCQARMHEIVQTEIEDCKGSVDWEGAMERSFERMDKEAQEWSKVTKTSECRCELQSREWNVIGSTAAVAVVTPDKVVVSNCGDSRTVLCRNGVAIPLSSDHKADRPDELLRIESVGGRIIYWNGARVLGVLAMSRAIGHNYLKPYVIPDPEVTVIERTEEDECLILASDGLWDVVSNETACGVARMCLRAGRAPAAEPEYPGLNGAAGGNVEGSHKACLDASILLTKLALARRSSDNVSVVVVDLRRKN